MKLSLTLTRFSLIFLVSIALVFVFSYPTFATDTSWIKEAYDKLPSKEQIEQHKRDVLKDPDNPNLHYIMGIIYSRLEEYEKKKNEYSNL